MNEAEYIATISFPEGEELKRQGTLQELAEWTDKETKGKGSCNIEIQLKSTARGSKRRQKSNEMSKVRI